MKASKWFIVLAIAAAAVGFDAYAFHSGGVAECEGCHSMHSPKPGGTSLLIGVDQSSTCLTCHAAADTSPRSYHIMTYPTPAAGVAPVERTPGGDFAWIKKDYTFTVRGTPNTELGQTHGHNIIAADYGYTVDTDYTTSPGGTFPSSQLGCQSCHDPHGKGRRLSDGTIATTGAPIIGSGSYDNSATPAAGQAVGVYRLLWTAGDHEGVTFSQVPPAVVPSSYNRTESSTQTRVAYGHKTGETWGLWCSSCHEEMHSDGNYVHPIDENLGDTISGFYNAYVSSGIMTGSASTSYLSLVPFAENTGDYTVLKSHAKSDNSYLNGPASEDRVMCLSCHRAHASGFVDGLRWNYSWEFITYVDGSGNPVWPGTDNQPAANGERHRGRTAAEMAAGYYDRPATLFGAYQRQLCNKCHAQD